ncbi:hypothetical protein [Allobranchiibius sp. GilTou38]|uniref:hypothetical protein n=1 Tax=Allobranchiibius sp. GilTou38 TaxID=2815210 RepID=UPI001AA12826|nr:hypothetical protein [Allobranchiibius sp. GilTou38]MBO1768441.1 hypothetical protein [Allobranchiibius sp. GilTou38]
MLPPPPVTSRDETVAHLHDLLRRETGGQKRQAGQVRQSSAVPALPGVPVHPDLRDSFPTGLRLGSVYTLSGSTTVAMGLLAEPTRTGSWCAAVGLPHFGVESAAAWGADLTRLVLVPHPPSQDWVSVVAALTEIADLILTSRPPHVTPGEVERLHARLRIRRTTMIVAGAWPRAAAHIEAVTTGWDGLGQGYGALMRQRLRITVTERHRERTADLGWPIQAAQAVQAVEAWPA